MKNVTFDFRILKKIWVFIVLSLIFFSCSKENAPVPAERNDINLMLDYDNSSRHNVTPHLLIYLNGVPVDVLFDTGSSGLRVLKGAVSDAKFSSVNAPVSFNYGDFISGTNVQGVVAGGDFSFYPNQSTTPLKFMLIDSVQVNGGSWVNTMDAGVSGQFHGLKAIMGVGMRLNNTNNGIASPLAILSGSNQFIVSLPSFGGKTGHIIINPNSADLQGFNKIKLSPGPYLLPNGYNSYQDNMLLGTVMIKGMPFTGPTILDTGNPLIWVDSTYFPSSHVLLNKGENVQLILGNPQVADNSFTIISQFSGKDLVEVNSLPKKNSFGIQFFFDYDVLFDEKDGFIGVRKK